ncbi:MAG: ATP-binding protein [Desulfuromonadales bacterium]
MLRTETGKSAGAVTGLGLGMSIVKSSIESHDGRIRIESRAGKGTCSSLEIPLHESRQ